MSHCSRFIVLTLLLLCVFRCHGIPDLKGCGSSKGCLTIPTGCADGSATCTQVVTWDVSPSNSSKMTFEMYSTYYPTGFDYGYIGFALAEDLSSVMTNSSVLFCYYDPETKKYVSKYGATTREDGIYGYFFENSLATDGLTLNETSIDTSEFTCIVERDIKTTTDQQGLVFPADQAWGLALAYGTVDSVYGTIQTHYATTKTVRKATISTDVILIEEITRGCGFDKGCLTVPVGCLDDIATCNQVVTWTLSSVSKMRIQLYSKLKHTDTSKSDINYVGFAMAEKSASVMGNASFLYCYENLKNNTVAAYGTATKDNQNHGDLLTGGLESVGLNLTNSRKDGTSFQCTVVRDYEPSKDQIGQVFPADQAWTLAVDFGSVDQTTGEIQDHYSITQSVKEVTISSDRIMIESIANDCGVKKGCLSLPLGCYEDLAKCTQIVTWRDSPDSSSQLRLQFYSDLKDSLGNEISYLGFALADDCNYVMNSSSVLFCYEGSDGITARYGYTENGKSKQYDDEYGLPGIDLESSLNDGSAFQCTIDRDIIPTNDQFGYVYQANQPWGLAMAFGPVDINKDVSKHVITPTKIQRYLTITEDILLVEAITAGCKTTKGCFTIPDDCLSAVWTCTQVVTWRISPDNSDKLRIELYSNLKHTDDRDINYVGFATAPDLDSVMSNSSVLFCYDNPTSNLVEAKYGATTATGSKHGYLFDDSSATNGLEVLRKVKDGSALSCTVDRDIQPSTGQIGKVFPVDQPWVLALSFGPVNSDGFVQYHYSKGKTLRDVNLTTEVDITKTTPATSTTTTSTTTTTTTKPPTTTAPVDDKDVLRKLHGTFMIIAWMLFVGASTLAPRYLRKHWITECCLAQLWFVVHRLFMFGGILFVIAGFITILVVNDGLFTGMEPEYPSSTSVHPYFGLIAIIILFWNPIGALLRCNQHSKWRSFFNWFHGLTGMIGFVLGAVNITLGTIVFYPSYPAFYPAIVWIGVHIVAEILLALITFCGPEKNNPKNIEENIGIDVSYEHEQRNKHSRSKRWATIVFVGYLACSFICALFAIIYLYVRV